jgi:WD40 repeat protein
MHERLKSDMCDVLAPGTLRTAIDHHKIDDCLSSELQYCCLYWVYHLQQAGVHASDVNPVYNFLTTHLLHWLEVLSLMGRASEGLCLIKTLQIALKIDESRKLLDFLDDAMRFVLANIYTIDSTPLQLYSSLLAFSPEKSKVRAAFGSTIPHWVCLQTELETSWGLCLQTLEGHSDGVSSVAFSPDSALLASASYDHTIRIWRTDTGECAQTLEGHSDGVRSVSFSPVSALLASASDDHTVRIWRNDTGECTQTLEGHSDGVNSVAFSHDSALLASASYDHTVRIWRTDTGQCVQSAGIGVITRRLSFQLGDPELLTDVGALVVSDTNPTSSACFSAEAPNHCSGHGISTDDCWITWHGHNLLWLPKEFRPNCSAISRLMVVIGCSSGRVLFVSLSSDKLPGGTISSTRIATTCTPGARSTDRRGSEPCRGRSSHPISWHRSEYATTAVRHV